MGAEVFTQVARGETPGEAFVNAVTQAGWDHGHSGYTGTMAEKYEYVMIPLPEGQNPFTYADQLIADSDPRVDDKWGPAGCIDMGGGDYLFFGWASS